MRIDLQADLLQRSRQQTFPCGINGSFNIASFIRYEGTTCPAGTAVERNEHLSSALRRLMKHEGQASSRDEREVPSELSTTAVAAVSSTRVQAHPHVAGAIARLSSHVDAVSICNALLRRIEERGPRMAQNRGKLSDIGSCLDPPGGWPSKG